MTTATPLDDARPHHAAAQANFAELAVKSLRPRINDNHRPA